MKKYFLFGVAIALAMGYGCALTDYGLITDNNTGGAPVGTNGKAFVNSIQLALLYPDGTDNLLWWVDQKGNGDQTIYTQDFSSSSSDISNRPNWFLDQLYCNPNWSGGCDLVVALNPNDPSDDPYDYKSLNFSCPGGRSLTALTSLGRYYGECGRASSTRMQSIVNIANQMTPVIQNGQSYLRGTLNSSNFTFLLNNNNGSTAAFGPASDVTILVNGGPRHQTQIDLSNPVIGQSLTRLNKWVSGHPGPHQTATGVFNGTSFSGQMKIMPDKLSAFIQQHF